MNKHKYNIPTKSNMKYKQQTGFTIIEVVLVLAIAGLIFLMAFIALPALQRNQRDTQRKQDLDRALASMAQYQANNSGQVRVRNTNWDVEFRDVYLKAGGSIFQDPDGNEYTFYAGDTIHHTNMKDNIGRTLVRVYWASRCEGEQIVPRSGQNSLAMTIYLESGGIYCANN